MTAGKLNLYFELQDMNIVDINFTTSSDAHLIFMKFRKLVKK